PLRVAVAGGPDALHPEPQRATQRVRAERQRIGPTPERLVARGQERVVGHQAVPARALEAERALDREPARALEERLPRRLAPQPLAERQLAGLDPRDGGLHATGRA